MNKVKPTLTESTRYARGQCIRCGAPRQNLSHDYCDACHKKFSVDIAVLGGGIQCIGTR
jgi:hypothetical protein